MSIIKLEDRIKEQSYTTGAGTFSLDGAMTGFSAFSSFYSNGDLLFYAASDGVDYEVGSGIYSANTLTRHPFKSTNSDSPVVFSAGIKEVYVTYPGKYSVFSSNGISDFEEPQASGLAFWESSQTLNYDSSLNWDATNNHLGVNTQSPQYAIHVAGDVSDAIVAASGFITGNSGVLFSGVDSAYSGGTQREPFFRNELDPTTGSDDFFSLSGLVDQRFLMKPQLPGTVLAGPSGTCGCTDDYPSFRPLRVDDIPGLSGWILSEDNTLSGLITEVSGWNQNYTSSVSGWAEGYIDGELAGGLGFTYWEVEDGDGNSKVINHADAVYISGVSGITTHLDETNNNLQISAAPLSGVVFSYIDTVSGYLESASFSSASTLTVDHLIFGPSDREISIGLGSNTFASDSGILIGHQAGSGTIFSDVTTAVGYEAMTSASGHLYSVAMGYRAGYESSGVHGSSRGSNAVFVGRRAGYRSSNGQNNIFIGYDAGLEASGGSLNIGIGYRSSEKLNNPSELISIGRDSSINATNCSASISLGRYSYAESSGCYENVSLGSYSSKQSNSLSNSVSIGSNAGQLSSGVYSCVSLGNNAGYGVNTANNLVSIGESANKDAKELDNTVAIGSGAGFKSSYCNDSIFIGELAGYSSSGNSYSIYLGKQAGTNRDTSTVKSLVIKTNSETSDFSNINSTNKSQDSLISINDVITGTMYDGTNSTNLRIGATGSLTDYIDHTLSIKPNQSTDHALHLHKSTSHFVPLLTTESSSSSANSIVNKNGYLNVPVFSTFITGSGAVGTASDNAGALFFDQLDNRLWISDGSNWFGFNSDTII